MLNLPENIIVFDTEFTAWQGSKDRNWSGKNEHKEIIQIGAVRVETNDFSEIDSFNRFVKPVLNPKLSDYIVDLTGITQELVEREGIGYREALEEFAAWSEPLNLYSWGRDEDELIGNCDLLHFLCPIDKSRFFDIRQIFFAQGIAVEKYQSSTIVQAFGQPISRRSHNALNDARTITDALRALQIHVL